jgi:cell division cycle 14
MSSNAPPPNSFEFIPDRLYYVALKAQPRALDTPGKHFFCIDSDLVYWNFFLDFGPLNLGQLYRFCQLLNSKLNSPKLAGKMIVFYSSTHPHKRTNAAYLISSYALLYLGRSPEEAYSPFDGVYPPFEPFHDASPCICTFRSTVLDTLRGIAKARHFNFFNFDTFDIDEYEYYEQVENGDLNWHTDKFLCFAGPHDTRTTPDGYVSLTPQDYIPYFKKKGVKLVVRLNKKYYDENQFKDNGIDHKDIYYLDGSTPPRHLLKKFLDAAEATDGKIAVHCKAGLGRAGTCTACYQIKHYKFTAEEIIGWMRVCRPGTVIGPQQHYLKDMEQELWAAGDLYRKQNAAKTSLGRLAVGDDDGYGAGIPASPISCSSPSQKQLERDTEAYGKFNAAQGGNLRVSKVANSPKSSGPGSPTKSSSSGSSSRFSFQSNRK